MYTKMSDISFNFLGKTAIVFGGSRGIGKEVCRQFASAGAIVYNASRTSADLHLVKDLKCDLTNIEEHTIYLFQA
jgi:NAD(P)-dependent dehydrogenase (short-subunit alcohol dehydrogenase family)